MASLALAGCTSRPAALTCPPGEKLVIVITNPKVKPPKLGVTSTTAVGNRDNDAGEGRIPDRVPDPDIDANQRHPECVTTGLTPTSN